MVRRPLVAALVACAGLHPLLVAQDGAPAADAPASAESAPVQDVVPASPVVEAPAPAPQIDTSDWPVIEGLTLDASAIERAMAPIAKYPFAPVVIDPAELRRTLVYMFGSKELRSFRLDLDLAAEMERQIAAGRDPAEFQLADEEIRKTIEQTIEQIKLQYPTLDPEDVLRVNNIHVASLERMTRQSRLFATVFLPEDPDQWPPVSVEALRGAGDGQIFAQVQQSFRDLQARIASGEMTEEQIAQARQGQATMRQFVVQTVIQALDKSSVVEMAGDGLPPEVAMRVDGRDVMTDVVFDEIAGRVTPRDIEVAKQWLTKSSLLEQVLASRGHLLSPAAARAAFDEHMAPMMGTMFPPEFFVVQVKGFPSMDLYKIHHRLLASYQNMIAAEITDEALAAHFEQRANELLNVARVGVEVILLSAYDFSRGLWKENGWADAEARAREVSQKLLEGQGANWSELQDQYSDFWDPPAPTTATPGQQPRRKNKGRFAPMSRNELLGEMGENEFTLYVDGTSVTDEFFFYTAEGAIAGPFKGRLGYYIGRVTTRTAPQGNRSLNEPDMRSMVLQDYVNERFNAFAREVFEAGTAPR